MSNRLELKACPQVNTFCRCNHTRLKNQILCVYRVGCLAVGGVLYDMVISSPVSWRGSPQSPVTVLKSEHWALGDGQWPTEGGSEQQWKVCGAEWTGALLATPFNYVLFQSSDHVLCGNRVAAGRSKKRAMKSFPNFFGGVEVWPPQSKSTRQKVY